MRSTGTTSTAIRRSRSTTRSRRTSCAEIAAYAHSTGMRVSGHVPAFLRAQDVVEQGYDEIQHINQLLLNFFVDDKTDTRTLRALLPAGREDRRTWISTASRCRTSSRCWRAQDGRSTRRWPTFDFMRQRDGEMSPIVAASRRPPAARRAARAPRGRDEDPRRCDGRALREVVRQDGRVHRPHVQGRRPARGRHRRAARVHPAARARAVRAGRPDAGAGAAGRDLERREIRARARRSRFGHGRASAPT